MGVYRPDEFKVADEENDLNSRLPDINKKRNGNYLAFEYIPANNYFANTGMDDTKSKKGSKGRTKKRNIPKPKNKGSKTARTNTPSGIPNLRNTSYSRANSKRNSINRSSLSNNQR